MIRKTVRLLLLAVLASFVNSGGVLADDRPAQGCLIGELGDSGVTVGGWASVSLSYTDNDDDSTLPQGFLNREDGFNINRSA